MNGNKTSAWFCKTNVSVIPSRSKASQCHGAHGLSPSLHPELITRRYQLTPLLILLSLSVTPDRALHTEPVSFSLPITPHTCYKSQTTHETTPASPRVHAFISWNERNQNINTGGLFKGCTMHYDNCTLYLWMKKITLQLTQILMKDVCGSLLPAFWYTPLSSSFEKKCIHSPLTNIQYMYLALTLLCCKAKEKHQV